MLLTLTALLAWYAIGCLMLAAVDDENRTLFKRTSEEPTWFYTLVVYLWPLVLFKLWRHSIKKDQP